MTIRNCLHLLLVGLLLAPRPVTPATITVDGQTDDATPGICDLVEAIENANTDSALRPDCEAGAGADQIVLTVDVTLTTSFDADPDAGTGTPPIAMGTSVTIEGNGHTIARDPGASDRFRILATRPGGQLTLEDVTVAGGLISNPDVPSRGGGILNRGTLTLNNSTVSGNALSAVSGGSYSLSAYGAGIHNVGTATIVDSTISGNSVESSDPGYMIPTYAAGGGISSGEYGGNPSTTLTITGSTISGNSLSATTGYQPSGYGAGLYVAVGTTSITNSTISGNSLDVDGYNAVALGGGLAVAFATVALRSTTLSGNGAQAAGAYAQALGEAVAYLGSVTPTLYGSAIGNHAYGNSCHLLLGSDGGGNLADDGSCDGIPATLTGLDPVLADNGGGTRTHALLDGSSAIDTAGDCGLTEDQRGVERPAGLCDSGSFEWLECSAPNGSDFTLPDQIVDDERTFTACDSITVADTDVFGPAGHLILRTDGTVIVQDGFSVEADGRLTVEIDGTITMPDTD